MTTSRRRVLGSLAGLAATLAMVRAIPSAAKASPKLTAGAFASLSATLAGYPVESAANVKMFKAFVTPARRADIAALAALVAGTPAAELDAALRSAGLDKLADSLVSAWYSGLVPEAGSGGEALVLYTDALMWTAMTFSKPMGVCGGPMGYWAKPPQ